LSAAAISAMLVMVPLKPLAMMKLIGTCAIPPTGIEAMGVFRVAMPAGVTGAGSWSSSSPLLLSVTLSPPTGSSLFASGVLSMSATGSPAPSDAEEISA